MTRKNQRRLEELELQWRWRIKKCGYTIRQFCDETGISYNTFVRIAKSNPTIKALDDIEEAVCMIERKCGLRG